MFDKNDEEKINSFREHIMNIISDEEIIELSNLYDLYLKLVIQEGCSPEDAKEFANLIFSLKITEIYAPSLFNKIIQTLAPQNHIILH